MYFPKSMTVSQHAERATRLMTESAIFRQLRDGEWPYRSSAVSEWDKRRLAHLTGTLDHTLCLPLLLAAHGSLTENGFSDLVHLVERTAFRYVSICGVHITPLSTVYLKHCLRIRESGSAYALTELVTDLNQLVRERAPDSMFEGMLKEKLVYRRHKHALIRYFLATVECYYDYCSGTGHPRLADKTFDLDIDELTVEHLYPQSPSVQLLDLHEHRHHLGNLTVLPMSENLGLGNSEFVAKREVLRESRLKLNREIAGFSQWTHQEFRERQHRLIEYGVKLFSP